MSKKLKLRSFFGIASLPGFRSLGNYRQILVAALLLSLLLVACTDNGNDDNDDEATALPPTATATTAPTQAPATEEPAEASLQERVEAWLLTQEGVSEVASLDVDLPEGEAPLVYVELTVEEGHNNSALPDSLMRQLNGELDLSSYSDFVVIITDPQQVVEYTLDADGSTWREHILSSGSN